MGFGTPKKVIETGAESQLLKFEGLGRSAQVGVASQQVRIPSLDWFDVS
jgi:hypothetical protein